MLGLRELKPASELEAVPALNFSFDNMLLVSKRDTTRVYRTDTDTGHRLALKVISLPANANSASGRERVKKLFEISQQLKQLKHQNIMTLVELQHLPNRCFRLFSEYISGESLTSVLLRGRLLPELIRKYTHMLCQAIVHMHSQRPPLAHGNINGNNVMVELRGNVKLIDFDELLGLGRRFRLTACVTEDDSKDYELHFVAPETLGKMLPATLECDIWSFGLTLYQMFTALAPYNNCWDRMELCNKLLTLGAPRLPLEGTTFTAREFYNKCVQRSPSRRPSAKHLLQHPYMHGADQIH